MKEIYRTFETLNMENQTGYTISEAGDMYEINFCSIWTSAGDKVRIKKEMLPESEFRNLKKIGEIQMSIENGCADYGQCWYKDKWWSYEKIKKIQEKHEDMNWKKHVS